MESSTKDAFSLLERVALDAGASSFGVASVEKMSLGSSIPPPAGEVAGFRHAVSIGCRLSDSIMDSLVDGPSRLYAYHYRIVNRELDAIALRVANAIQRMGYDACPIPASQIVDWESNVGHASHRWAAYHAGLGWYGRNNLIISPQYGARVRYVTVFTTLPLPEGQPLLRDCGDCRACIGVCPAGAIAETRADFELAKCQEQLRFFRNKSNIGHYICGLCIKACPGTRNTRESAQPQQDSRL
jgi:epoxyqueuosine reductase